MLQFGTSRSWHLPVFLFSIWKLILFIVVALVPGPGYDTSSTLLIDATRTGVSTASVGQMSTITPLLVRFVRWDAIYLSQIVRRGYLFEQDSFFAPGFPALVAFFHQSTSHQIRLCSSTNHWTGSSFESWYDESITIAFVGVTLSTICHLLSVILLLSLTATILSPASQIKSTVPMATAVAALHIINPAGVFLLSPYSEALFSFLNILGFHLYLNGLRSYYDKSETRAEIQYLVAGSIFGLATTVRSNGILNGSLFLYDAAVMALSLVNSSCSISRFRHLIVICISGCLVALGAIVLQYLDYVKYCNHDGGRAIRPWCNYYVPSIYAWVQHHYWYEQVTTNEYIQSLTQPF